MTDTNESAQGADLEVVADEAQAPEAVENTQGQDQIQPAEDEGKAPEAEDKPSPAKLRRERRKAEKERLYKQAEEAKAEAERAKAELARIEETSQSNAAPKEADFDTLEEYQAALSAHHSLRMFDDRRAKEAAIAAKEREQRIESVEVARKQELAMNWQAQVAEATEKYSDFEKVVMTERTVMSAQMQEMVMDSDAGADVAYYLCSNPAETQQIATLPPLEQARRIGAIEARVAQPSTSKITQAPDPITPIKGNSGAPVDPEKMTVDQWRAWREAGGTP